MKMEGWKIFSDLLDSQSSSHRSGRGCMICLFVPKGALLITHSKTKTRTAKKGHRHGRPYKNAAGIFIWHFGIQDNLGSSILFGGGRFGGDNLLQTQMRVYAHFENGHFDIVIVCPQESWDPFHLLLLKFSLFQQRKGGRAFPFVVFDNQITNYISWTNQSRSNQCLFFETAASLGRQESHYGSSSSSKCINKAKRVSIQYTSMLACCTYYTLVLSYLANYLWEA